MGADRRQHLHFRQVIDRKLFPSLFLLDLCYAQFFIYIYVFIIDDAFKPAVLKADGTGSSRDQKEDAHPKGK
jgi:hypothetical protein